MGGGGASVTYRLGMDLITCGDALWISCGTWLVVWNGLIGALIAAVLAAGVAMLVVLLSTNHQTKLAKAERRAQQNAAIKELKQQSDSLKLQLAEQRAEASKARETAAIADMLAAIAQLDSNCIEGETADLEKTHLAFESAMIRWEMELDHEAMAEEIQNWHFLTRKLVAMARWESDWDQGTTFRDALSTATHGLADALKRWPKAHGQTRDDIFAVIKADRELAMDPIDKDIARREARAALGDLER